MIERNKVYCNKVEQFLPKVESEFADLIIADPPFNKGKKYDGYDDNLDEGSYYAWVDSWIKQSFRILKSSGSFWIYCPTSHLGNFQYLASKKGVWQNTIVWFYSNPTPDTKRFPKTWSAWLFFSKTDKFQFHPEFQRITSFQTKNHSQVYDVWYDIPKLTGGYLTQREVILKPKTEKRQFIYQLPIVMIQRIIGFCSNEGDLVVDLFSHSGTTSKAAQSLKRDWIAVEQSKNYCDMIEDRMKIKGFSL